MFQFRSQLLQGQPLLRAIRDDEPSPGGGLTRISPFQNRHDSSVGNVQQALLIWRADILPRFGADGDFGDEAAGAVHRFKVDELHYTDRKSFYTNRALEAAFGGRDVPDWDPDAGFAANRPRILALYDYYRDLYLRAPRRFLWAGLGRRALRQGPLGLDHHAAGDAGELGGGGRGRAHAARDAAVGQPPTARLRAAGAAGPAAAGVAVTGRGR